MSGNKALRRALDTKDAYRIGGQRPIPLIQDKTELITPEIAQQMLESNKKNRPINWKRVEQYAVIMRAEEWELNPQGIVFDKNGDLQTGQQRLWAVIYSKKSIYMRVSRGSPSTIGKVLDRGMPQSARDLATRDTGRKHSPVEASIARAILVLKGTLKPSTDMLAEQIRGDDHLVARILKETSGTKKTKPIMMILAAICADISEIKRACDLAKRVEELGSKLEKDLEPESAERCWGRGAAFTLAMERAKKIVDKS